jgi:hypothetical protein
MRLIKCFARTLSGQFSLAKTKFKHALRFYAYLSLLFIVSCLVKQFFTMKSPLTPYTHWDNFNLIDSLWPLKNNQNPMKQYFLSAILLFIPLIAISQTDKYHSSFVENFSGSTSAYFRYGSTGNKTAFKYKLGVNSMTVPDTKILSFKIDPEDIAGAGRGPEIISKNFTHFGTYATRLKVPEVKTIQPNIGAVVGYFTYHVDSLLGLSEIDMEWLIADPTVIYVGTWTGHTGELKRIGRTINTAKGIIYNTSYREGHTGERTPLTGMQN